MIKAKQALTKLIEGNERFYNNESIHPNLGLELRNSLVNKQTPFAAIIACSDSRVPVEIVFDAGIGDLFVIRTAGHVLSKETMGSLEYAVTKLKVKLVVILGHDNCGAVQSALAAYKTNKYNELSENIQALLGHINPFFDELDMHCPHLLNKAITSHIKYQVDDLVKKDKYLAKLADDNKILIVGAKYNLETGKVEILYEYKSSLCSK